MSYLQRYHDGDHERVWDELQALGPAVRHEPLLSDARAVAAETMRRVRRNCERLVQRLRDAGSRFGVYPDGSEGYYSEGPLVPALPADVEALTARTGPLPLSLEAFWTEVGCVNLVGMHPGAPELLDPLVVDPPFAVIEELDTWEEDGFSAEDEDGTGGGFEAPLAPDDLHKDNVSGGLPYAVLLPDPCADFVLLNERHGLGFVPYLRMAILRWGGFPGLDGRPERFASLDGLVADLEAF